MKKLLILHLLILIFGCTRKDNPVIKIGGFIENSEIEIVQLKTIDSTYIDTIIDGRFSFNVREINFMELKLDEWIPLFAEFGDSIFIDYERFSPIQFSGLGFEESEFLQEKKNLMAQLGIEDSKKIDITLYSSEPEVFLEKIDNIKRIRIKQLDEYRNLNPKISNHFYNTEILLINYFWINQQFGYPGFTEMLTNNKPDLPDDYYKFTNQIETNNKELFQFSDYKSTLSFYLDFRAQEISQKYTLAKELFSEEIFEDIMFREMNSEINFNGIDAVDSIYVDFLSIMKDNKRKDYLTQKYKSWVNLAKGKRAPEFEIMDNNSNNVKLSDYNGKFVYIDCWSSFCGPCLSEMPEMKKLSDELKNENIVFLSISADNDKEKWLNKIREFELENTINLCTEGTSHKFNEDYNAKAFPRYILIDDEGFIIDATAEKPSRIKEELKRLL